MSLASRVKKGSLKNKTLNYKDFPEWYQDSGNYALNIQVSGRHDRGFRGCMIWQLAGLAATAKTRVWVQAAQLFLRDDPDRTLIIYTSENDPSSIRELEDEFGERVIAVPSKCSIKLHTDMKQTFKDIIEYLDENRESEDRHNDLRTMIVVDSWGLLNIQSYHDKVLEGKQPTMNMTKVSGKNALAEGIIWDPLFSNSLVFITNHVYISPDDKSKEKQTSGGCKLEHASQGLLVQDRKKADKNERSDKVIIKFQLRKGRPPTKPGTVTEIPLEYHKGGFTRYGGLSSLAVKVGALKLSGSWYQWSDKLDDKKFRLPSENLDEFYTKDRLEYIDKLAYPFYCFTNDEIDKTEINEIEVE